MKTYELSEEEQKFILRLLNAYKIGARLNPLGPEEQGNLNLINRIIDKLTPKKVQRSRWINVYPDDFVSMYTDKERADHYATENRITCLLIEWEEEQ